MQGIGEEVSELDIASVLSDLKLSASEDLVSPTIAAADAAPAHGDSEALQEVRMVINPGLRPTAASDETASQGPPPNLDEQGRNSEPHGEIGRCGTDADHGDASDNKFGAT